MMVSKRQRYSGAARRWLGAHAPLATAVPPRAGGASASDVDYRSLGKVQPYRGGDLEQPGELARAAAATVPATGSARPAPHGARGSLQYRVSRGASSSPL